MGFMPLQETGENLLFLSATWGYSKKVSEPGTKFSSDITRQDLMSGENPVPGTLILGFAAKIIRNKVFCLSHPVDSTVVIAAQTKLLQNLPEVWGKSC